MGGIQFVRQTALSAALLAMSFVGLHAQISDSLHVPLEEGWIENMTNKIGMDISLNNSYEIFEVNTPSNDFKLHPNAPTNLRLKLNYEFVTVGFQFAPDFIPGNGDEELKGKTNSFAIGTSLIFKHLYFDLSYSKVQGYYLQNTGDFIPWTEGDPYIQYPDLHYNGFTISSGYINNSKFSLKSLRSHTERQLKSAGSFLPAIDFRYYTINDKSSDVGTQKSDNLEVSLGPGYYHTFVSREKYYFSIGMQAGLGYLRTKFKTRFETGNIITHQDNFIFRWDGKTGIGYNGSRFYSGLYATVSGTRYNQQNTTVTNFETRVFYHLFLGIRLEAPDCLKKQVIKIKDKMSKDH